MSLIFGKRCLIAFARRAATLALAAVCLAAASGTAHADCIDDAAKRYGVNADLLRAVAYHESRMNPRALNHNGNGSIDIGLMQINSIHLAELKARGISRAMLNDAEINAAVGASLLRRLIDQYGATWRTVGEYHSHTPSLGNEYARAVHQIYLNRPWERRSAPAPVRGSSRFLVQAVDR